MSAPETVAYIVFCEGETQFASENKKIAKNFASRVGGNVMPVVSRVAAGAIIAERDALLNEARAIIDTAYMAESKHPETVSDWLKRRWAWMERCKEVAT